MRNKGLDTGPFSVSTGPLLTRPHCSSFRGVSARILSRRAAIGPEIGTCLIQLSGRSSIKSGRPNASACPPLATTEETRREYEHLAAANLKLAEAELKLAPEIDANNAKAMNG